MSNTPKDMLGEKEVTHVSKFLSLVLRHQPELIAIVLDDNGWTDVELLLKQANAHGIHLTPDILNHVVASNAKKRFAFNDDHTRIRASQGHSVSIDLGYTPAQPPAYLYHGTAEQYVESILKHGLEKRSRQHVHLSADIATTLKVGQRHSKPKILLIDAGKLHADDFTFYLSANRVWLSDAVPPAYLSINQN